MHWSWRILIAVLLGSILDWAFFVHFAVLAFALTSLPLVFILMAAVPVTLYALLPGPWETRCRHCGDLLRGISEPKCPDCGEPI